MNIIGKHVRINPLSSWGRNVVAEHGKFFLVAKQIENRIFLVSPKTQDITQLKDAEFGLWISKHDAQIEAVTQPAFS